MATLVKYTCKSFIKLTPDYKFSFLKKSEVVVDELDENKFRDKVKATKIQHKVALTKKK